MTEFENQDGGCSSNHTAFWAKSAWVNMMFEIKQGVELSLEQWAVTPVSSWCRCTGLHLKACQCNLGIKRFQMQNVRWRGETSLSFDSPWKGNEAAPRTALRKTSPLTQGKTCKLHTVRPSVYSNISHLTMTREHPPIPSPYCKSCHLLVFLHFVVEVTLLLSGIKLPQ